MYLHSQGNSAKSSPKDSFSRLANKSLNMSITCTEIKVIKFPDIMHISFKMLAIDGAVLHFNLIFVWQLYSFFTVKSKLSSKTTRTFLMKDYG